MKNKNLTDQAIQQLELISCNDMNGVTLTQLDKSTAYFVGYRFGKYEQKFTVSIDESGNVVRGSVRFYE